MHTGANSLKMAECWDRETPVNDPFDKSLILCPKIPSGDLILKVLFKDSSEFLFFLEICQNLKARSKCGFFVRKKDGGKVRGRSATFSSL